MTYCALCYSGKSHCHCSKRYTLTLTSTRDSTYTQHTKGLTFTQALEAAKVAVSQGRSVTFTEEN
jgi:hypothetical protein